MSQVEAPKLSAVCALCGEAFGRHGARSWDCPKQNGTKFKAKRKYERKAKP